MIFSCWNLKPNMYNLFVAPISAFCIALIIFLIDYFYADISLAFEWLFASFDFCSLIVLLLLMKGRSVYEKEYTNTFSYIYSRKSINLSSICYRSINCAPQRFLFSVYIHLYIYILIQLYSLYTWPPQKKINNTVFSPVP